MARIDWITIKVEYISTNISLRELAEKHKVSFNTIKERCSREEWVKQRVNFKHEVTTKIRRKLAKTSSVDTATKLLKLQTLADNLANIIDRITMSSDHLFLHQVQKRSKSEGEGGLQEHWGVEERQFRKPDTRALMEISISLKNIVAVIRNVYGIPTVQEQSDMDIAKRRLDLDEKKASMDADGGITEVVVTFGDEDTKTFAE